MADETPRIPTSEELAAIELRHALAGMGPDTDRALMVTLRLPDGTYVADIWLSTADVTALTDGALSMSLISHTERQLTYSDIAAAPLPMDEDDCDPWPRLSQDDITDELVEDMAAEFVEFLKSEGGQQS
ncbi:hypothetical protein ACWC09_26345 [Streptomyces sp. NPDC001617]